MVFFWASVGSVYESLVIQANSQPNASQTQYQAVYPKATFSSNIRGIIPNAPWMSAEEKEGAQKVLDFMLTPESQQLAASLGLRPGIPSISLGNKFSSQYGVNPNPNYESYRPPAPEVVEAMLTNWQDYSKKTFSGCCSCRYFRFDARAKNNRSAEYVVKLY